MTRPLPHWKSYGITLGFLVLIAAISFLSLPYLGYRATGFIFLVGVLPIAVLYGLGPTLLFAVMSTLVWDYFFIPPQFTFTIHTSEDVLMNVTYFVVAIATGLLGTRIRRQEYLLKKRERHTQLLYELEKTLAPVTSVEGVLRAAENFIREQLNINAIAIDGSEGELRFANGHLSPNEREEVRWTYRNERRAGHGTQTFPQAKYDYYPLEGNGAPAGALVVENIQHPDASSESRLRKLCPTIGTAIERERHRLLTARNRLLEESEKLHQTLLNSVSHELRTPLTSILGNIDRLETPLGEELRSSARRLNQTVTNLLDMSRVTAGALQLKREVIELNDFMRSCISRSSSILESYQIVFTESQEPIIIRADEKLLETAVVNLFTNAARHAPQTPVIYISAHADDTSAIIEVSDTGPGIPDGEEERVFEKFYSSNTSGGVGLGLAITRTIMEAHGGAARVVPKNTGGARFQLSIPREELRQP